MGLKLTAQALIAKNMFFDGLTNAQLKDLYFCYTTYRNRFCAANNTCRYDIDIISFFVNW